MDSHTENQTHRHVIMWITMACETVRVALPFMRVGFAVCHVDGDVRSREGGMCSPCAIILRRGPAR